MTAGRVVSICIKNKKTKSINFLVSGTLKPGIGIEGDYRKHRNGRELSLLAIESIRTVFECVKAARPSGPYSAGDFSENICTEKIDLSKLTIGDRLNIGKHSTIEITSIGRECYKYCVPYARNRGCAVARQAVFAKVVCEGAFRSGAIIKVTGELTEVNTNPSF